MTETYEITTNKDRKIEPKFYDKVKFQTQYKENGERKEIQAKDLGFEAIKWIIDEIKRAQENKEDRVILLGGEVRVGKSALAAHLAARLGLEDYENICYEPDNYLRLLHESKKGKVSWLDEGGRGMYYKNAMTKENKLTNQTFQQIGAKNLVSIICLPHKNILDKELRQMRVHYWGQVKFSGYDRGFVKWRIAGKRKRRENEMKVPRHENEWKIRTYWEPLFKMRYPKFHEYNGFTWEDYEKQKMKKLNEFTEEALAELDEKDKKSRTYKAINRLKESGMDISTLAEKFDYSESHIYKILEN